MRRSFPALVLLLALAGCGGDGLRRVPVTGKLTAQGRPIDNATLQFLPTGTTRGEGGIGRSDAAGHFTLIGSRQGEAGVVAGEYKVRVSRMIARDGTLLGPDARQAENPGCWESIPEKYASIDSGLTVVVPAAGGTLDIDIPEPILGRD